uniref:Lysine-specific histone demethylase 1A n=1 Tax=Phallusia mammillata TaxID=59560 RepID=A0A6F9DGI2_9ASCI|nr:lysine-specific histone demethylase 1A [Phallusia mammillata]
MDDLETEALGLEGAAFQSRLPPNELSPEEKSLFPDVDKGSPDILKHFLFIRNRILQLWLDNPKVELIYEIAVQSMAESKEIKADYIQLSLRIHKYLEIHGFINFGIFKRIHPIRRVKKGKVVVIGAGIAGLAAARQLTSFGMEVIVVEARDRVGGRISTYRKGKFVADLGAMVVTGLGGNPITVISKQINMELHKIRQDCPLYETGGKRVPKEKDVLIEQEFNKLLEATAHLSHEMNIDSFRGEQLSLGKAFELVIQLQEKKVKEQLLGHWKQIASLHQQLKAVLSEMLELEDKAEKHREAYDKLMADDNKDDDEVKDKETLLLKWNTACKEYDELAERRSQLESEITAMEHNQPSDVYLSSKDRQLLDWHLANLEFANAAPLAKLSLKHWNQDDAYEFSGSHLVVRNGYSILPTAYADGLDIRVNAAVRKITYGEEGCRVVIQSTHVNTPPTIIDCDIVVCTLPLGVLRPPDPELDHGPTVVFEPPLPSWKTEAIERLGFGNLNKVVLCFDRPFWESAAPNLFGHIGATTNSRGELFLFWAIYRAPVLIALVAGESANVMEHVGDGVVVSRALAVLKAIFGTSTVPEPLSYTVTRWGSDPWSHGSYSYVATGSSGEDYDVMAAPVDCRGTHYDEVTKSGNPRVFFAGEHTMRNYPATVHGALLSGFREAARISELFLGAADQSESST